MDTPTSIASPMLAPKQHLGDKSLDVSPSITSPTSTPAQQSPEPVDTSSPDAFPTEVAATAAADPGTLEAQAKQDDNSDRMASPESNASKELDTPMLDEEADGEQGGRSEDSDFLDDLILGAIDGETLDDLLDKQKGSPDGTPEPSPEPETESDMKKRSTVFNSGAGRKKPRSIRTVSIKYTPAEKYWLNRTYRAYRVQQAAQKQAKADKTTYTAPSDGLLTHASLMDAFNARFRGKYVDGVTTARPPRERHAFGLWSAKNMREDDEDMKGSLPDYWVREKKTKPVGISLAEVTSDEWDTDEYLGVTADAPVEGQTPQKSRKRKVSSTENEGGEKKKARVGGKVVVVDRVAEFNRVLARAWPVSRPRRYSAPDLRPELDAQHLRPVKGGFDYSWKLAQAQHKSELGG